MDTRAGAPVTCYASYVSSEAVSCCELHSDETTSCGSSDTKRLICRNEYLFSERCHPPFDQPILRNSACQPELGCLVTVGTRRSAASDLEAINALRTTVLYLEATTKLLNGLRVVFLPVSKRALKLLNNQADFCFRHLAMPRLGTRSSRSPVRCSLKGKPRTRPHAGEAAFRMTQDMISRDTDCTAGHGPVSLERGTAQALVGRPFYMYFSA